MMQRHKQQQQQPRTYVINDHDISMKCLVIFARALINATLYSVQCYAFHLHWTDKKRQNTKGNGKCPPYADPFFVIPHQPNFACWVVFRISFLVLSFIKIG